MEDFLLSFGHILHGQGLIDSKGEEGMKLPYCYVYLAKFKLDMQWFVTNYSNN